jgi:hypothetical protein
MTPPAKHQRGPGSGEEHNPTRSVSVDRFFQIRHLEAVSGESVQVEHGEQGKVHLTWKVRAGERYFIKRPEQHFNQQRPRRKLKDEVEDAQPPASNCDLSRKK